MVNNTHLEIGTVKNYEASRLGALCWSHLGRPILLIHQPLLAVMDECIKSLALFNSKAKINGTSTLACQTVSVNYWMSVGWHKSTRRIGNNNLTRPFGRAKHLG